MASNEPGATLMRSEAMDANALSLKHSLRRAALAALVLLPFAAHGSPRPSPGHGARAAGAGRRAGHRRHHHLGGDEPLPAVPRRARFPPPRRGRERTQRARGRAGPRRGERRPRLGARHGGAPVPRRDRPGRRPVHPRRRAGELSRARRPQGRGAGDGRDRDRRRLHLELRRRRRRRRAWSPPTAAPRCRSAPATAAPPWRPSTSRSPASRSAAPSKRSPCAIS